MQVKHSDDARTREEPMGIVIADGGVPSLPTRFSAYVWGPVPDDDLDAPEPGGERLALTSA